MARPTTKQELLTAAKEQYSKMWKLIDSMAEGNGDMKFDFGSDFIGKEAHWQRDKNLRDALIHVYEWHQLLLKWVEANRSGEAKPFLPEPYNWKTYSKMNVEFWEKHQNTPYDTAVEMLKESHENVIKLIEGFSDGELFTKKYFSWTGTSSLGSYCISATSAHYDWMVKKIKQHNKNSGKKK